MLSGYLKVIPVLLVSVFISACGTGIKAAEGTRPEEKIRLKIYTQYTDTITEKIPFDYAKMAMEKVMPNVELDLEVEAQDDNLRLKTYAAAGNLPDIFRVTSDTRKTFERSKNLLLLDGYIEELKILDRLTSMAVELIKDSDGHFYSVMNMGIFTELIYYNGEIFQKCGINKIPANFNEFLEAVKTIREKGILPIAIFSKEKWPAVQLFDLCTVADRPGGMAVLEKDDNSIGDEAYKHAAEKVVELVKAGAFDNNRFETQYVQAAELFKTGGAAMIINGSWTLREYGDLPGDEVDFMLPSVFSEPGEKWNFNMSGGGFNSGYSVSANTRHRDSAAKYAVQFALKQTEGRTVKASEENFILNNCPEPEQQYNALQEKYAQIAPAFKTYTCFPWGLTNAKFKTQMEDSCQELLTGQLAPEDFIKSIRTSLER